MSSNSNQDIELRDWLALSFVAGVGRRTAKVMIERFDSPTACLDASPATLESQGLKRECVLSIKSPEHRERAESELVKLKELGAELIVLSDPRYPPLLREIYDPPIVLYVIGDISRALAQPGIAIVGSRHCSTYGRNASEMIGRDLAANGVTIISGLARGIDGAAHKAALDAGGQTIAVMGTGIDVVYPKEHKKLAEQIAKEGVLMTEFPLGTPPLSQNFPFRNRVISGLGFGVVIVEGAERSGSLITARMARDQGRDVFAVPGNITSSKSFGPNYLIKDGAKLVQTWQDVVEELPSELKARILSTSPYKQGDSQPVMDELVLSETERNVLSLIKLDEAIQIDQLIYASKLSRGELMSALLKLEMLDRIRQLPGKSFARRP
jgi:DNA processing protein